MPRVIQQGSSSPTSRPDAPPIDQKLLAFRSGFERSRKGNLWRTWPLNGEQVNVTVFSRDGESYRWCLADANGPHFSADRFESEDAAVDDLLAVLVDRVAESRFNGT